MAEFKMAAIIKLSQNEWVKFFCANGGEGSGSEVFFGQMVGTNPGKCEWVWEEKLRWLNPRWPNSRWLSSISWVRMNKFDSDWISLSQSQSGVRVFLSESERRKQGVWIQPGRIQDDCHHQVESEWMSEVFLIQQGRIEDGCHHKVKWEWMSLSQIELVWFRLEGECFWVNLREDKKVSESKMAVSESNLAEFKMTAIIKLSQNEWVKFS